MSGEVDSTQPGLYLGFPLSGYYIDKYLILPSRIKQQLLIPETNINPGRQIDEIKLNR